MIKPLPNRILVKLLPRYESKNNLILVDKRKHFEGSRRGEVLAVGSGIRELKAGDVVWFHGAQGKSFGKNSNDEVTDGVDFRTLRSKDVLGVEEEVPREVAA